MIHVYEFTNKRKLTKREFIHWFEKKFLYTLRKFDMIHRGEVIAYENKGDFKGIVLEHMLKLYSEKSFVELVKENKKYTKKALTETTDDGAKRIAEIIIKGDANELEKISPIYGKEIKPLFLFLDKEVLLYAKLMDLKFKQAKSKTSNISAFIDNLETKHPEIKNSIISSYLELF